MSHERYDTRVAGMDCENEAGAIQRGLRGRSGVIDVETLAKSGRVRVTYDDAVITPAVLADALRELGYPPHRTRDAGLPPPWRNPKVVTSAFSGLLLLAGFLAGRMGAVEVGIGAYVLGMLVGGWYFGREAAEDLIFERSIGIELLMGVAAVAAAALGEPGEGAMLVFLYSISEAFEGYTEERTRSAIRALMDLTPQTAHVLRGGVEVEITAEDLAVEDRFVVRPGESIPTDGTVEAGRSSVDQSPVTGESVPVERSVGDTVFAGSINGSGALTVLATRPFAENTVSRIIQLVEEAQERKGERQRLVERFGRRYSPAVLGAGLFLGLVPTLLLSSPGTTWITRAVVFVVAAAPCALVISVPITAVAALGSAARRGILIKGGVHLEELAKVRVVALDKTGTLTRGVPVVTGVVTVGPADERQVLAVAAGLERWSEHPLARAIVARAREHGAAPETVDGFMAVMGGGARGAWDGQEVRIGSPAFLQQELGSLESGVTESVRALRATGHTVVLLAVGSAVWGVIGLRDELRANARKAVEALRRQGVRRVVMLTGDHHAPAEAVAKEAGVDEVRSELKPEDKVRHVADLAAHGHVAMVGDGVNDAPALAAATVGVAMGAAGTDVALETADVALMGDDLERLAEALHLARETQRIVRQNLVLSGVVISGLVVGALGGWLSLPMAVVAHEVSEFLVIGNGLRAMRILPGRPAVA